MAITVGTLIVDLEANTASFVSGLDKAGQMSLNSATQIRRAFETMAVALAGAMATAEAAIATAVAKAIENAARLHDVAQATGTTTAALSALEYAAKQSGLSAEQLDKGLEKMAKSALAAASGGRDSQNAYKTLGVSVTDANRQLRPTQDILADLATKFRAMPDGPMKTALAIQIFGRAGADLVPLLNRGKEGITELMEEAKKLGLVIDDATAIAAKHFEESMIKVKSRAEGAATALAEKLLPALNFTLERMNQAPPSGGWLNITATTLIGSVAVLRTWLDYLQSIGSVLLLLGGETVAVFNAVGAAAIGTSKALTFDFSGAEKEYKAGYRGFIDQLNIFSRDWKSIWSDNRSFIEGLFKKPIPDINAIADQFMAAARTRSGPGAPSGDAEATRKAAAAIRLKIEALEHAARAELQEAAAQQGNTAATWLAIAAIKAQQEIDDLNAKAKEKKIAALTSDQEAQLRAAEVLKLLGSKFNETNKALADETIKTNQQTAAMLAMAAAYDQGGAAIAKAEKEAKLAPFQEQVRQTQLAFDLAKQSGDRFNKESLADLAKAAITAQRNLEAVTVAIDLSAAAMQQTPTKRLIDDTLRQASSEDDLTKAILSGRDALEAYDVQQKLDAAQRDKTFDPAKANDYRAALEKVFEAERLHSVAQRLDALLRRQDIDNEIADLRRYHDLLIANGATELDIDSKIHGLQRQRIQDYRDELLQLNSVSAGVKAFFLQYQAEGSEAQRVNDFLTQGFNDLESNIAKALSGQKVAWADFFKSIAEMLNKLLLQMLFFGRSGTGGIFGSLFGSLLGGGSFLSAGVGAGSFSTLFPGLAEGGNVNPGQFYLVGENGPEILMPRTAGTIIPNSAMAANAGPAVVYQTVTVNIQTPDVDSFRRSREQIAGDMAAAAARAARRK